VGRGAGGRGMSRNFLELKINVKPLRDAEHKNEKEYD
jgi:hypothetical protein